MKAFFGGLLIAIGLLVAGLCGLCTGFFFLMFLSSSADSGGALFALLLGGLPTLGGIGLVLLGRRLVRQARLEQDGGK